MTMPDNAVLSIAVAQIETRLGDLQANKRTHLDVIGAARAAGAQVLVFPELSLAGHAGGREAPRLALTADEPDAGGACGGERRHADRRRRGRGSAGRRCSTTPPSASRGGRVLFRHRKVNLATYGRLDDGKHFAAGAEIRTHEVAAPWRAAVLICADLWNPPLVHLAALSGATVLLAPISSGREAVGDGFDNPEGWAINARFHAMTYGLPLALANRVGTRGRPHLLGRLAHPRPVRAGARPRRRGGGADHGRGPLREPAAGPLPPADGARRRGTPPRPRVRPGRRRGRRPP